MSKIEELRAELIAVLTKMDKIMPVQFHDIDCDDCVFNFSDVTLDKINNRVYVEVAMWHDNLPAHRANPIKDGRGRVIPAKKIFAMPDKDGVITNVRLARLVHNYHDYTDVVGETTKSNLIAMCRAGEIPAVNVNEGEKLYLCYNEDGFNYFVTICNKMSSAKSERFEYSYGDTIVEKSIRDGVDYCMSNHSTGPSGTDKLRNVNLTTIHADGSKTYGLISECCTRIGLAGTVGEYLKNREIEDHEQLGITYEFEGKEYFVSLKNYTSDVQEEWFSFDTWVPIIGQSILDGEDYIPDYWNAKLKARRDGKELSPEDYMNNISKAKSAAGVFNAVKMMSGE